MGHLLEKLPFAMLVFLAQLPRQRLEALPCVRLIFSDPIDPKLAVFFASQFSGECSGSKMVTSVKFIPYAHNPDFPGIMAINIQTQCED